LTVKKNTFVLCSAFEAINNFKTELLMVQMDDDISDKSENLIQRRYETLVLILGTAKPLNGKGFFDVNHLIITSIVGAATTYIVVLLQFNMSESSVPK
jgi:hypothetical protein